MNRGFEPYLVLRALCTGVFLSAVAMAALAFAAEPSVTLTAPKEASAGAEIAVEYSEAVAPLDFISIDKAGAGEPSGGDRRACCGFGRRDRAFDDGGW